MIASWMLHATLVSLLLALAARAAEAALSAYRLPVRWAWVGAAAGSLVLPAAAAADLSGRLASLLSSTVAADGGAILPAAGDVSAASPAVAPVRGFALPALPTSLEPVAAAVWAAGSLALAGWTLRAWLRLRRRRRGWERTRVDGVEVLVSEATGPAAIGVLDPDLVLPRWVLELPPAERRMVLRHEREHRDARDSVILGAGLAALVAAPWNVALWWIGSRLRLAVEIDCDRRVLADGASPGEYGALLLEITLGRRVQPLPTAALGDRRSRLEKRIRAMTDSTPRFRPARTAFLALAGAGLLVAACDAPTPFEESTEPDASASAAAEQATATSRGGEGPATAYGEDAEGPRFIPRDADPRAVNDGEIGRLVKVHGMRLMQEHPDLDVRGTVTVWLFVGRDGWVKQVRMQESSGRKLLDQAAMSVAPHMEFEPATRDGEPIGVWVSRSVTFGPPAAAGDGPDPSAAGRSVGDILAGRPGASVDDRFRVRSDTALLLGSDSSPLIFVDGERIDKEGGLDDLDPKDIESIEVLKGPAATGPYGEEGRRGVIRITTKAAADPGG